MKKYDSYKDSGVEWIGEIPSSWSRGKLGFFSNVFRGSGYQYLNHVEDDFEGRKEKVVRIGDISDFKPIWCEYIEQFENYRILKDNILIGGTGHYFGKSIYVTEEMEGLIHSYNIIRLVINNQYPKFIQYYISSNLIREQMDISVLGSGQPFIDIQGLKDLQLIIPPINEQQQIVEFLDTKTTLIDSLIEKTQRKIELLKEKRTSLINHVVTKGINPDVEMKDSGVEWIGEIPINWDRLKVKYLGSIKSGDGLESNLIEDKGEYPVYGGNGILGYYSDFNQSTNVLSIGRVGEKCGNVHYVDKKVWINDNSLVFEPNEKVTSLWFVFHTLTQRDLNQLRNKNTQPLITGTLVKNEYIPFPPQDEQQQIVEYLDEQTQIIDTTITKETKRIELLKEYRQSLISEVVTGKIKVTTDE